MKRLKVVGSAVVALVLLSILSGCAARVAFDMAEPARHDLIEVGMNSDRVEALLRPGIITSTTWLGLRHAHYEYSDGPSPGWKVRGFFYLLADVATLFAIEVVHWPVELVIRGVSMRGATAYYDENGGLLYFQAVRGRADIEVMSIGDRPSEIALAPVGSSSSDQ